MNLYHFIVTSHNSQYDSFVEFSASLKGIIKFEGDLEDFKNLQLVSEVKVVLGIPNLGRALHILFNTHS